MRSDARRGSKEPKRTEREDRKRTERSQKEHRKETEKPQEESLVEKQTKSLLYIIQWILSTSTSALQGIGFMAIIQLK